MSALCALRGSGRGACRSHSHRSDLLLYFSKDEFTHVVFQMLEPPVRFLCIHTHPQCGGQRLCVQSCISPLWGSVCARRPLTHLAMGHIAHCIRTLSYLTREYRSFRSRQVSTSFRGCGPLGIERPVLRTGSITLLRYVSLPVQGRSDRVWARGAEDSDRRVRWATTPPAWHAHARARARSLASHLRS